MKSIKVSDKITERGNDSIKKYFSEISKKKLLSPEEELDLAFKSRNGDGRAKNELIESNLRFVVTVAKHFQNNGLSLEDLINDGNLGLIKAADRFDETKGFKFISYAVWWIRQSILSSLAENARIVRIPTNKITSLGKIGKTINEFQQEFEREPTAEELAHILCEKKGNIIEITDSNKRPVSLDAFVTEDEGYTIGDTIPDESPNSYEVQMHQEAFFLEIENVVNKLKPREKMILCMHLGIIGFQQMTLEEIGDYFDLTRERVRQIKESAVRSLRVIDKCNLLKQYVGQY